jgi:hypothetical protein
VTRHDGIVMSVRGEVALERGKGGDDASWADTNLTRPKIKKIHVVNSVATNGR